MRIRAAMAAGLALALMGCDTTKPFKPIQASKPAIVQAAQVNAALTPIKILAGFDSITVGEQGRSWRDDMDVMLRARGFKPTWVVTAVGGTRCVHWAPWLSDLVKVNKPDLVIIHCGTNDDVGSAAARQAFANAHMSMIMSVKMAYTRVMVSTIQISNVSTRPDLAWLPGYEVQSNVILRANALFYGDVAFADISLIPATPANNPDGVHPGPPGQALHAAAWISAGAAQGWWAQ